MPTIAGTSDVAATFYISKRAGSDAARDNGGEHVSENSSPSVKHLTTLSAGSWSGDVGDVAIPLAFRFLIKNESIGFISPFDLTLDDLTRCGSRSSDLSLRLSFLGVLLTSSNNLGILVRSMSFSIIINCFSVRVGDSMLT